jgi:hypothetical protein
MQIYVMLMWREALCQDHGILARILSRRISKQP